MSQIIDYICKRGIGFRANLQVEVRLYTEAGGFVELVPSGASTGAFEAVELKRW